MKKQVAVITKKSNSSTISTITRITGKKFAKAVSLVIKYSIYTVTIVSINA